MDLEELITNEREISKDQSQGGTKQKKRFKDTPNEYKQRKSISQMKQYASVSKRFSHKKDQETYRKKK